MNGTTRLLVAEARPGLLHDCLVSDLPDLLSPGDLLVVNDAATLPASLPATTSSGATVEVRLAAPPDPAGTCAAVLFGPGDWRTRTEDRTAPPPVGPGEVLVAGRDGAALVAAVVSVSPLSPRLVTLGFDRRGEDLLLALYRLGRPVQYAHRDGDLALWSVQTAYAGRPWAVEMPSAGYPLGWDVLGALRRRGVELAAVTHAAGLSATGDPALDAALPLPERYEVGAATAARVSLARTTGRRVIAVGTSVVRALESAARFGLTSTGGRGTTDLLIGEGTRLVAVDGLVTGIHQPGESHHRLLGAFAPPAFTTLLSRHAEQRGYRDHETGDLCLLVPELVSRARVYRQSGCGAVEQNPCGVSPRRPRARPSFDRQAPGH